MFKRYPPLNSSVHRENQTIIFNLYLFGPPASGRRTFIQWLADNENLLDANFLKSIENERKQLRRQVNGYMRNLKDLPRMLKQNLIHLIQNENFTEAKTYFDIATYRIQELCRAYDRELERQTEKSIKYLQSERNKIIDEDEACSSLDIVGSKKDIIYRIHYDKKIPSNLIELTTFLSSIDGIIFIWDVSRRIEVNLDIFKELLENLPPNVQYPLVIALNKMDLPHTISTDDVYRLLTHIRYEEKLQTSLFTDTMFQDLTIFETVGTQGHNLRNIVRSLVRMIVIKNQAKIQELQNLLYSEVQV